MAETVLWIEHRRSRADECALVLAAEGLRPAVRALPEGFALCVPEAQVERARAALESYERENLMLREVREAPELPTPSAAARHAGLAWAGTLLVFFAFVDSGLSQAPWMETGAADAARIRGGEFWRAATALTLHADVPHVFANAAIGGIFLAAVCRALGAGVGIALVVLAGILGNLLNAAVRDAVHVSIGASTAVFGAVGLLAGIGVRHRRRRGGRRSRVWAPAAAALGLLAMLGTSGQRVDLWAHFFGLLAGAALGLLAAPVARHPPAAPTQLLAAAAALAALVASWAAALGAPG